MSFFLSFALVAICCSRSHSCLCASWPDFCSSRTYAPLSCDFLFCFDFSLVCFHRICVLPWFTYVATCSATSSIWTSFGTLSVLLLILICCSSAASNKNSYNTPFLQCFQLFIYEFWLHNHFGYVFALSSAPLCTCTVLCGCQCVCAFKSIIHTYNGSLPIRVFSPPPLSSCAPYWNVYAATHLLSSTLRFSAAATAGWLRGGLVVAALACPQFRLNCVHALCTFFLPFPTFLLFLVWSGTCAEQLTPTRYNCFFSFPLTKARQLWNALQSLLG